MRLTHLEEVWARAALTAIFPGSDAEGLASIDAMDVSAEASFGELCRQFARPAPEIDDAHPGREREQLDHVFKRRGTFGAKLCVLYRVPHLGHRTAPSGAGPT